MVNKRKLKNTKSLYCKNGIYLQERSIHHDNIIKEQMDGFGGRDKPIAILMGGGSASGKTWLRDLVHEEQIGLGNRFLIIDSDEIKKMLPEYNELIEKIPEKMASTLHDESSDIASLLLTSCITEKINFIFDGTMKNKHKYIDIIDKLIKAGYEVRAMIADVNVDEAIRRNEERFKNTKRKVPLNELINSHAGVADTFVAIKDKLFEYALYDTFDDYNIFAYKIHEYGMTVEKVNDENRMQNFLEKTKLKVSNTTILTGKKSS